MRTQVRLLFDHLPKTSPFLQHSQELEANRKFKLAHRLGAGRTSFPQSRKGSD